MKLVFYGLLLAFYYAAGYPISQVLKVITSRSVKAKLEV